MARTILYTYKDEDKEVTVFETRTPHDPESCSCSYEGIDITEVSKN